MVTEGTVVGKYSRMSVAGGPYSHEDCQLDGENHADCRECSERDDCALAEYCSFIDCPRCPYKDSCDWSSVKDRKVNPP